MKASHGSDDGPRVRLEHRVRPALAEPQAQLDHTACTAFRTPVTARGPNNDS